MIEIPENVEDWTYGKIVDLVNEGYDENNILEIKKDVNSDSNRFAETVCAFANTNGGTILFGIDNNRIKPLHLTDRIHGLDDSDQLKRNIVDKIKHIQPSIPIKDLIFRKTNIKIPNKKVIVILKVQSSSSKPHQYHHIFRKRLSDGNDPMSVEEIKNQILTSSKQQHNEILLMIELGMIKSFLEKSKQALLDKQYNLGVEILGDQDLTSTIHFQHNLAYLYSSEVPHELNRIIDNIEKLSQIPTSFRDVIAGKKNTFIDKKAEEGGQSSGLQHIIDSLLTRIDTSLEAMSNLEKILEMPIAGTRQHVPKKYTENPEIKKPLKPKQENSKKS